MKDTPILEDRTDSGSQNLADGSITFTADPGNATRATVIYCPEEEVTVRMTVAAGSGSNGIICWRWRWRGWIDPWLNLPWKEIQSIF